MITLELDRFGKVYLLNYIDLTQKQTKEILQMRNHPEIRRWMYSQQEITYAEHEYFVNSLHGANDKQYFCVIYKGSIIGAIYYTDINVKSSEAFLGLFASKTNKLIFAPLILEEVGINYAFGMLGVNFLNVEVFRENLNVIKLHQKYGYKELGVPNKKSSIIFLQLEKINT